MKKRITISISVLAIISVCIFYYEMSYVPFAPLKYDEQKGLITTEVNGVFYKNLAQLLAYYKVPYRKEGDVIYIRRKISQDKHLVWNYTSKALNEDWLKTHIHH